MFVENDGTKYEHIHLIEKETDEYDAGWYFSDECEQLHGPFISFEGTLKVYENYIKNLG
jgi:hypothetical protein